MDLDHIGLRFKKEGVKPIHNWNYGEMGEFA